MSENFGLSLSKGELQHMDEIANEGASMRLTPARSFWLANMAMPFERWAFNLGRREAEWMMENAGKC